MNMNSRRQARQQQSGLSLRTRRRWYADEPTPPPPANQPQPEAGEAEDINSLPAWVQQEIRALRKEAADRRIALRKAEEDKARMEAATLAEQGKWKELAEKRAQELDALKPASERVTALEARISATNDARIKQIPEALRTVIPSDYTPEKLSEWLDANLSKLTVSSAPNTDAGARGDRISDSKVKLTEEQKQMAKRAGMTEEQFATAYLLTSKDRAT